MATKIADTLTAPRPVTVRSLWRARAAVADLLSILPREIQPPAALDIPDWELVLGMVGEQVAEAVAAAGLPSTPRSHGEFVARALEALRGKIRAKAAPGQPATDRWMAVDRVISSGSVSLPSGELGLAIRATLSGYTLRESLHVALKALDGEVKR